MTYQVERAERALDYLYGDNPPHGFEADVALTQAGMALLAEVKSLRERVAMLEARCEGHDRSLRSAFDAIGP